MKREYDFSRAVRGKFFQKGAELNLPIYVDSSTRKRLERIAKRKGTPVTELVNQLLKKDVELIESLS
jgi:cytidylate kinase